GFRLRGDSLSLNNARIFSYQRVKYADKGASATSQYNRNASVDPDYLLAQSKNLSPRLQLYIFKSIKTQDLPYALLLDYQSFGQHHRMSLFTDLSEAESKNQNIIAMLKKELTPSIRQEDVEKWEQLPELEGLDEAQYQAWWKAYLTYLNKPELQKELAQSPLGNFIGVDLQDPLAQEISEDILLSWGKKPLDTYFTLKDAITTYGIDLDLQNKLRGSVKQPTQDYPSFLYDTWITRQVQIRGEREETLDFQVQIGIEKGKMLLQFRARHNPSFLEKARAQDPQNIDLEVPIQSLVPGKNEQQGMLIVGPFDSQERQFRRRQGKYSVITFQKIKEGQVWFSFGRFYDKKEKAIKTDMLATFSGSEPGLFLSQTFFQKRQWPSRTFNPQEAEVLLTKTNAELRQKGFALLGLPEWFPSTRQDRALSSAYLFKEFIEGKKDPLGSLNLLMDAYLLPFYKEKYQSGEIVEAEAEPESNYLKERLAQAYFRERINYYADASQAQKLGKAAQLQLEEKQTKRRELFNFYETFLRLLSFEEALEGNQSSYTQEVIQEIEQIQADLKNAEAEAKEDLEAREKQR
ncbi:MAG: hypothetical protein AAFU64_10055, partial [Bacteroidota bacterium]